MAIKKLATSLLRFILDNEEAAKSPSHPVEKLAEITEETRLKNVLENAKSYGFQQSLSDKFKSDNPQGYNLDLFLNKQKSHFRMH